MVEELDLLLLGAAHRGVAAEIVVQRGRAALAGPDNEEAGPAARLPRAAARQQRRRRVAPTTGTAQIDLGAPSGRRHFRRAARTVRSLGSPAGPT